MESLDSSQQRGTLRNIRDKIMIRDVKDLLFFSRKPFWGNVLDAHAETHTVVGTSGNEDG